jgi:hypothetical protein
MTTMSKISIRFFDDREVRAFWEDSVLAFYVKIQTFKQNILKY